jgi:hypothetical protein
MFNIWKQFDKTREEKRNKHNMEEINFLRIIRFCRVRTSRGNGKPPFMKIGRKSLGLFGSDRDSNFIILKQWGDLGQPLTLATSGGKGRLPLLSPRSRYQPRMLHGWQPSRQFALETLPVFRWRRNVPSPDFPLCIKFKFRTSAPCKFSSMSGIDIRGWSRNLGIQDLVRLWVL